METGLPGCVEAAGVFLGWLEVLVPRLRKLKEVHLVHPDRRPTAVATSFLSHPHPTVSWHFAKFIVKKNISKSSIEEEKNLFFYHVSGQRSPVREMLLGLHRRSLSSCHSLVARMFV